MIYKKSQAAMENLTMYSIIIFIALVAIGFFSYSFFSKLSSPDSASLNSEIIILDTTVYEDEITLVIQNTADKKLVDFQLEVSSCEEGTGVSAPVTLNPYGTTDVTIYCTHSIPATDTFTSSLKASYDSRQGLEHSVSGSVNWEVIGGKRWQAVTCGEITEPGKYVLVQNLPALDPCITISANHVVLNGNGYKFTHNILDPAPDDSLALYITGSYVELQGVEIVNFDNGIHIDSSDSVLIYDSRIDVNNAFILESATNVKIFNSLIFSNEKAISLFQSNENYLNDVTVISSLVGLELQQSQDNLFKNSLFCGSADSDLVCLDSSSNSDINLDHNFNNGCSWVESEDGLCTYQSLNPNPTCDDTDLSGDGVINLQDLARMASLFSSISCSAEDNWCEGSDINQDSWVNQLDVSSLVTYWGDIC